MRRFATFVVLASVSICAGSTDPLGDAIAAMQHGDFTSAEQILHDLLRAHPADAPALEVLGVVLDQEKKYDEADRVYHRALGLGRSSGLLNNYGNHLLATGKVKEARRAFLGVLALDPSHINAEIQLAHIALQQKAPAEAIAYIDRLPADMRDRPDIALLTMEADYELGKNGPADALLQRLSATGGPDQNLSLGRALAAAGRYDKAEGFLAQRVEAQPDNFEALYDLGLAASHAGHNERAREVLQKAAQEQPDNANVLYDLAAVDVALHDRETALALLARAKHLAPNRPETESLLARIAGDLGYFADAVQAWSDYLKLVPGDETARRERAFAETATGENMQAALADLRAFVLKYPKDAVGWYELGTSESPTAPGEALKDIDRALAIQPSLVPAHVTRGLLLYRQGKPDAALPDFEFSARHQPANATALDRLGETYLALGRSTEAVRTLQQAAQVDPQNASVLFHLGRALSKAGDEREAAAVFARYRDLGAAKTSLPHPAGLVDFLGLSPEEQQARYRAGVERTVRSNPDNADAQVQYLGLLLQDGKFEEAETVCKKLATLKPDASVVAKQAVLLMEYQQVPEALELLNQASVTARDDPEIAALRAIAVNLNGGNSEAQFKNIENRWPKWNLGWLAHALVCEANGQVEEAQRDLKTARLLGTRSQLADYLAASIAQNAPSSSKLLTSSLPLLFP
jgi:tetratricopeptide (TPR) repeat protein